MIPHASGLPIVQPATRRIVVEQAPTGVVGEWHMTVHCEGLPEGWGLAHTILLDAAKEAAWQWVLEDRKRRQASVPQIIVAGNGERH